MTQCFAAPDFNVTTIVDTGGDALERYVYSPYGVLTIHDATWSNFRSDSSYDIQYTYTGRRLDHETGLFYFRHRQLSPQLGRFLSRDPIGYADGLNCHQYAHNIPIVRVDPAGLADIVCKVCRWRRRQKGETVAELDANVEGTPVADAIRAYVEAANSTSIYRDVPGLQLPTDPGAYTMGRARDLKNTEQFVLDGKTFPPGAKQITYSPVVVEADVCGHCSVRWTEDIAHQFWFERLKKWVTYNRKHQIVADGVPTEGTWVVKAKIKRPPKESKGCDYRIFFVDITTSDSDIADPPGLSLHREVVNSRFEIISLDGNTLAGWLENRFEIGVRTSSPYSGYFSPTPGHSSIIPEPLKDHGKK